MALKGSFKSSYVIDYYDDILQWMFEKESVAANFYAQSPQFSSRGNLLNIIFNVSEHLGLSNTTVHLTVKVLDLFMDNHDTERRKLALLAMGCLLIASKFEETDCNVPRIPELDNLILQTYPMDEYLSMEFVLLEFFGWNLNIPTAAQFAEFFSAVALLPQDRKDNCQILKWNSVYSDVLLHLNHLLNMSLLRSSLICVHPSLIAASCLAGSRKYNNINPVWGLPQRKITRYSLHELTPVIRILFTDHTKVQMEEKQVSPDKGYETGNQSPEQGSP